MMTARKIVITMSLLMLANVCWSQVVWTTDYNTSGNPQSVSNVSVMTNPAYNTWHNLNAALVDVSVSAMDGAASGLDTSGCIWNQPNQQGDPWVKDTVTPCQAVQIVVADQFHKYGLYYNQAAYGCTGNTYAWMWWNGQNWFPWNSAQNACLVKGSLSTSPEGLTCGVGANTYLYCQNGLYGGGSSFQQITGAGAGWTSVAVQNDVVVFLSNGTHQGKCTFTGVVGALVCTYTEMTPTLPNVVQIAADQSGHRYALATTVSGANVYRLNDAGTAWQIVYGLGSNRLSFAGPMALYATKSTGATYRLGEWTRQNTVTLTGHTTCNGACPNGSSHTPMEFNGHFGSAHIGGGANTCPAVPPEINVFCPLTDTIVDPFFCDFGGTECDFTGQAQVQCTAMALVFSDALNDKPSDPSGQFSCWESPDTYNTTWKPNTTVHVYFDDGTFVNGTCPGPEYCGVFAGFNKWNNVTINHVHYTNMGVVHPGATCGPLGHPVVAPMGIYNMPCNPIYPFLYVSRNQTMEDPINVSATIQVLTSKQGQWSITGIMTSILGASIHDQTFTGAHEEGHRIGLGDCNGPGRPPDVEQNCGLTESQSVMWGYPIHNGPEPTGPTPCDILWGNVYLARMR